jgi:hypothetical protein
MNIYFDRAFAILWQLFTRSWFQAQTGFGCQVSGVRLNVSVFENVLMATAHYKVKASEITPLIADT